MALGILVDVLGTEDLPPFYCERAKNNDIVRAMDIGNPFDALSVRYLAEILTVSQLPIPKASLKVNHSQILQPIHF